MMYRKLFWLMTALLPMAVQAQQDKKSILEGNEYYRQQQYDEAAAAYQRSLGHGQESVVGNFNLGAAWYKQKKLDEAIGQFTDIAGSATDKTLKAKAYHNLGNALLESQKLEESIEAYKQALLNNPKDDETRYNLAYAQEKLKQQQQNNPDRNKDNQDQKNKDQDNRDQDNKDNKDPNKDNQDPDNKDQEHKDNNEQDQGKNDQQSQPGQLSKQDAERLLEAMAQEEKNTQEKLKKKKGTGQGKVVKQW